MSIVSREFDGAAVQSREIRTRLADADLIKLRSSHLYVQRLKGWTTPEIARYFSLSRQHVNREIRSIPDRAKRIIEGKYNRGEIGVA